MMRQLDLISFRDYLGLLNACSYDVIGRADRFGFQNFCSPGQKDILNVIRQVANLISSCT